MEIITGALLLLLLFVLLPNPLIGRTAAKGKVTQSINNCRNVIMAFKLNASDHNGEYPDAAVPSATDSNAVFKQLFLSRVLEDERIFGCQISPFKPDWQIGDPPDFKRALEPGENHWAMTKGLNHSSNGGIPLVYENPSEATWPAAWDRTAAGKAVKGRTWTGGKIIIGSNDGSVQLVPTASGMGARAPLHSGLNGFSDTKLDPSAPKPEVLDVAVKEKH